MWVDAATAAARLVPHWPLRLIMRSGRLPARAQHDLYWNLARRLPVPAQYVSLVLDGARVSLQPTGAGKCVYWTGSYEPESLGIFLERAKTARTILDIGAHDGVYALSAAAVNASADVWAFEPNPDAFRIAAVNLHANPNSRVRLVPFALGDAEAQLPFFLAGANSSLSESFRPGAVPSTVKVRRGDDFLSGERVNGVDLIKVDTESTEPTVLEGLRAVIGRDHPEILCEVLAGRTESQLTHFVEEHGYEAFSLRPGGPVRVDRIAGDPSHTFVNYLFSHPQSRFRSSSAGARSSE